MGSSGLPEGPPAGKGIGLEDGVAGTKTFAKPVDDIRKPTNKDESIFSIDNADDLTKDQTSTPQDTADHSQFRPSLGPSGPQDPNDESKTKYPYRDGIPNAHNASASFVAGMWILEQAPELRVKAAQWTREAARLSDVMEGLNPKVIQRSKDCVVTLKRADPKNFRWLFAADCGNGPKVVRLKLSSNRNVTKVSKKDLHISCSCPAWRWMGSEYHAKNEDYLNSRPRGTASEPVVRDPDNINRVCKHVAAVIGFVENWVLGNSPNVKKVL